MRSLSLFLIARLAVNVLRLIFGIHDRLVVIQPVIPGKQIADTDRDHKKRNPMISKELESDQKRRDRAVGYTTKYRHHTKRSAKRRR